MFCRVLFALFALSVMGSLPADAQILRINGSSTVTSAIMEPHEVEIESLSGQQIQVESTGSGHGVRALLDGAADIAMISAPLSAVLEGLNSDTPGSIDGSRLIAHEIGANQVAFVIHPSNPVHSVTQTQLYGILSGRIDNWSQLGGFPLPIRIMVEPPGGGVRSVVESNIKSRGETFAAKAYVPYAPMIVRAVSENVEMFGIASMAHLNASVDPLATGGSMEQRLFLVTIGQPNQRMVAVIEAARATWRRHNGG